MTVCREFEVRPAVTPDECAEAKGLFLEYANSLGFDLCFQNFDRELANLPGDYSPEKRGILLLAYCAARAVGCVALHSCFGESASGETCEIKRLYVNPQWQGQNIGRTLIWMAMQQARRFGYTYMRLDTIASQMEKAIALYRKAGFYEIPAYRPNPAPDVMYMEVKL